MSQISDDCRLYGIFHRKEIPYSPNPFCQERIEPVLLTKRLVLTRSEEFSR